MMDKHGTSGDLLRSGLKPKGSDREREVSAFYIGNATLIDRSGHGTPEPQRATHARDTGARPELKRDASRRLSVGDIFKSKTNTRRSTTRHETDGTPNRPTGVTMDGSVNMAQRSKKKDVEMSSDSMSNSKHGSHSILGGSRRSGRSGRSGSRKSFSAADLDDYRNQLADESSFMRKFRIHAILFSKNLTQSSSLLSIEATCGLFYLITVPFRMAFDAVLRGGDWRKIDALVIVGYVVDSIMIICSLMRINHALPRSERAGGGWAVARDRLLLTSHEVNSLCTPKTRRALLIPVVNLLLVFPYDIICWASDDLAPYMSVVRLSRIPTAHYKIDAVHD